MNRKAHLAPQFRSVAIVGVGGTGSYLAQGLAKLIAGYRLPLAVTLIDPDVIEEKNCSRQNFQSYEIGQPKAEALAYRLNQQYGVNFSFFVGRGENFVAIESYILKVAKQVSAASHGILLVTCVDTVEARQTFKDFGPWLDLGNAEATGQALYGNTAKRVELTAEAKKWATTPTVTHLPGPYLLAGMAKLKTAKAAPSCADHPFAEQGCFVNEWAAAAGLTILHQLLVKGQLETPAIYFDSAKGRMAPLYITRDYLTEKLKGEK